MKISQYIENKLEQQGRSKIWIAEQIGVNYKTLVDRLKNDRLTAYDIVNIGKSINLDLNELKHIEEE